MLSLPHASRRTLTILAGIALVATLVVYFGNTVLAGLQSDAPSQSVGTTSNGHLINGKRLPTAGPNFQAYSRLGALLGRNSVHSAVRQTVLAAYQAVAISIPEQHWVYGESGWPRGGPFWPHRTHENGLSIDFMVPLRRADGQVVVFPTSAFTRFGYDLEFDREGRLGGRHIDFEAIAKHLLALRQAAAQNGLTIDRVIMAPEYQPLLLATPTGRRLADLPFMRTPAWVRHDEHYHVDFRLAAG